jgi:CBS domain-containing protein
MNTGRTVRPLLAKDLMTAGVATVAPRVPLAELERSLSELRISGMPVVDPAGEVLGVVSRADIVRALSGAESQAEAVLAYYRDVAGAEPAPSELARMMGERAIALHVEDVMATDLLAVRPDQSLREVASLLAERRLHRVLVMEGRRLLGLVSSLDIVRAVADGRLVSKE